jgi:hypothetical protein
MGSPVGSEHSHATPLFPSPAMLQKRAATSPRLLQDQRVREQKFHPLEQHEEKKSFLYGTRARKKRMEFLGVENLHAFSKNRKTIDCG